MRGAPVRAARGGASQRVVSDRLCSSSSAAVAPNAEWTRGGRGARGGGASLTAMYPSMRVLLFSKSQRDTLERWPHARGTVSLRGWAGGGGDAAAYVLQEPKDQVDGLHHHLLKRASSSPAETHLGKSKTDRGT